MSDRPIWATKPESQWPENTVSNFGLEFNSDQLETFIKLKSKRIVQPKYIHIPTLQSLGILDEVRSLMSTLGIWDYCTISMPAYRTLTYEFLSTLEIENENTATYYLDGTKYSITMEEVNNGMGFPNRPEAVHAPAWDDDTSFHDFSCQLIGGPRRTYKASQISHPVFRYIQRALAFTIFARGETVGTMGESEFYFIYAMLNAQTRPDLLPNVGVFMFDHFLGVKDNASPGGMITMGGFVTRLAIHHRVLPVDGPIYRVLAPKLQKQTEYIDMAYLQTAGMFSQHGDSYFFTSRGGLQVPLPLPVPIDTADPSTWVLPLHMPPPVQPQHQQQPGAEAAAQPFIDPFGMPPPEQQPPPYWAPAPGQPTPQQMYELMQTMNTNITNLATQSATQYTQLRDHVDGRFTAVEQQIAELRTYIHDQASASQTYMSTQFGGFHTDMTQLGTQMGQMHIQYSDLAGEVDEMADQQHGTYHRTDRMYTHMSRAGYVTADPIPRRRRRRPAPPQEGDPPPQQD